MKDYVRERVVIDAQHAIALAEQQRRVEHKGLRGRLRELVAQRLLRPWFPPYVGCGTGTIIHGLEDRTRPSSQDDLVLYDRSLMPPILIEEAANEGVFLNNSVLARIEVKSALNATEIKSYLNAAKSYSSVGFVASPGLSQHTKDNLFVRNCLLAFGSDTKNPTTEIERYIEALQKTECSPTLCSVLCVVGNGLWMLRSSPEGKIGWYRLKSDSGSQQLACFVASISSTLFHAHLERTGGDPASTFEAGIGLYFPHNDEWEEI